MPICIICQGIYKGGREYTCSETCHEIFVARLIRQFGEFKKVVQMTTGVAYKVPTRDILERGIREQDLGEYPIWEDEKGSRK